MSISLFGDLCELQSYFGKTESVSVKQCLEELKIMIKDVGYYIK